MQIRTYIHNTYACVKNHKEKNLNEICCYCNVCMYNKKDACL